MLDARLTEIWAELFQVPRERWDHELIGWFLRAAYGQGYCDALREPAGGSLTRELGYERRNSPAARGDAQRPAGMLRAPMRGSNVRLVVSLIVASTLGAALIYSTVLGGTVDVVQVQQLLAAEGERAATCASTARSSRTRATPRAPSGLRIQLADNTAYSHDPATARRASRSSTTEPCPRPSATAARSSIDGKVQGSDVRRAQRLAEHEVPVEVLLDIRRADAVSALMELLGRGALLLALLAAVYAPIAALVGARMHDQRLITSARRALAGCFVCVVVASGVLVTAIVRHDFRFASVAEHSSREVPRAVPDLVVLVEPGGLAAALAARPQRPLGARHLPAPPALARAHAVPRRVPRRRLRVLRVRDELRGEPVRRRSPRCRATAPASCPSLQNPYMLTHPPLLYLGYVGLHDPVRVRDGRARQRPHRRALAAGRAALDARALARARRRHAAGRQVGLRGDRLGRVLGLGSRSRTPR